MTWSLYKDTGRPFEEWEKNMVAWFIDEDASTTYMPNKIKFLHDGEHEVYMSGAAGECKFPTKVRVVNGEWEEDAELKILAMTRAYYHGEYIEMFYRRHGKIYVVMGS